MKYIIKFAGMALALWLMFLAVWWALNFLFWDILWPSAWLLRLWLIVSIIGGIKFAAEETR